MRNENLGLCPERCCGFGEFKCQVSMPINGKVACIDYCISHIVAALNAGNIQTIASCCGHGKVDGNILLEDGREIVIRKFDTENHMKD